MDFLKHSATSREIINDWVESQTNNKIKNLIQPQDVHPDTGIILVNGAYFKGEWLNQFQSSKMDSDFFCSSSPFY